MQHNEDIATRFLNLLISCHVLRFGEFKTKSGRLSPYFFNAGLFNNGPAIEGVARLYAEKIARCFPEVDNLYGPAYKGIPLATVTSVYLSQLLQRPVSFTFNRKEAKDHGEGGNLVGYAYRGGEKVVVIEDVITGGTSFRESLPQIIKAGAAPAGIIVGVDRQERGETPGTSALSEISAAWNVRTAALINLDEIIEKLHNRPLAGKVYIDDVLLERIRKYRATYGS